MLQQGEADDYAIATGISWSVKEFVGAVFALAGLDRNNHVEVDPPICAPRRSSSYAAISSKQQ